MYVCHITLAATELLCLRTFAFGNVWSKAFRKWLWHVLQHWDSGRTPCTTTGSVARHNPSWDVRSGNSAKERGEWKGGDRRRGGGVAGLSPSPSFFRHLSSCGCLPNALKWVKPSTSASAPGDPAHATIPLQDSSTERWHQICGARDAETFAFNAGWEKKHIDDFLLFV